MFYEEFTVEAWSYVIPFLVMVGVLYAAGAEYIETHMICFFPEVGTEAITEKAVPKVRYMWPPEIKKAA